MFEVGVVGLHQMHEERPAAVRIGLNESSGVFDEHIDRLIEAVDVFRSSELLVDLMNDLVQREPEHTLGGTERIGGRLVDKGVEALVEVEGRGEVDIVDQGAGRDSRILKHL